MSFTFINSDELLQDAIKKLMAAPVLAFDLEFDRDRYSYGFTLCLVQIATKEDVFIIDPLAIDNLRPLLDCFEQSPAQKLCYSCGEDLRLLHSLNCYPGQVVDVEIFAKLLNYERTSLAAILLELMEVEINKSLQKVNWASRPLTEAQLHYAAGDVVYLMELHSKLVDLASTGGILEFAHQEMTLLNGVRYDMSLKTYFLKPNDERYLSPHAQYVLNAGFVWRDAMARAFNKPTHQIMPEIALRELILENINIYDWLSQRGLHPHLRKESTVRELSANIQLWHQEADLKGLSQKRMVSEYSNTPSTRDLRAAQKIEVWQPIQQHILERFGERTMRFMLSTTQVEAILNGRTPVNQMQPPYRRMLITDATRDLGLDITPWM